MDFSFISLLNASISASWLVCVVILLRLVLKKAPKAIHCALWALVAIRLLCPVSIESPVSLVPSTETVSEYYQTQEAASDSEQAVLDIVENPVYPEDVNISLDLPAHRMEWSLFEWNIIWPAGMILMAAYAFFSWLRLRRKVAVSIPIARDIRICDYIDSPFILGIFRPTIYLPSDMDQAIVDHVLAHERAHLARRDHWWKPLGFVLLSIHWFNPVMWLAYILLCRDIELACDEKVIRDLGNDQKKAYSTALLQCSVGRSMIAACPLAFGEVGVKERVKTVLSYKKPAFWFVVLAVILCCVVAVCFLTDPLSPDVYDVMYQEGYTILAQCDQELDITIPMDVIRDEAFSSEGQSFAENEVVLYRTDTTTLWLMHIQYANEGNDLMYFDFGVSHDLPKVGTILTTSKVKFGTHISSSGFQLTSRTITDQAGQYEESVSIRGLGPGQRFTVYIDTDVARNAKEFMTFSAKLNQLTYAKFGAEPEIPKVVHPYDPNYKTWSFYSDEIYEFDVGINADGRIAFYDPYAAFSRMTALYADAILYLRDTFDLPPLTPLNYADYKKLDSHAEAAPAHLRADCLTVSEFLDIYENSFTDAEDAGSELLAEGNYVSQENVYWAVHSSLCVYDTEMEVSSNALVMRFNEGEWSEGPFPLEANWQTECPISDQYRELLADLSDIEPAFTMEDLSGCRFLNLDAMHFLVEKNSELYVVSWQRSNISLEIINYIFRMVPEAEYVDQSGTIHLGYATLETDPVDEAICSYFLEQNAAETGENNFTSVSFQRHGEIYSQQDDEIQYRVIMAAVRVGHYTRNSDGTITEDTFELLPVRLRMTQHEDGTYAVTDCDRDDADYSDSAFILEVECWRQAYSHFQPDLQTQIAALYAKYPEYFSKDTTNGLDLVWWNTPDGVRCVILSGLQRARTSSDAKIHTPLTVPEAIMVLQYYKIPIQAMQTHSTSTLAIYQIDAP